MARLAYSAIASLDGYISEASGGFEWAAPDQEVHAYVNELERRIGTHLYGRRMYETMVFWDTQGDGPDDSDITRDYAAVWRAADKIVFSRTLGAMSSARTRIERAFSPAVVQGLKASAGSDLSIGGAELAGQALAAGLVDDLHVFVVPVLVGGGTRALPDGVMAALDLVRERRFANGFVHLHYELPMAAAP
jgi:dihydrofolate reductase